MGTDIMVDKWAPDKYYAQMFAIVMYIEKQERVFQVLSSKMYAVICLKPVGDVMETGKSRLDSLFRTCVKYVDEIKDGALSHRYNAFHPLTDDALEKLIKSLKERMR